ncbi:MAG: hypothetical protein MK066_12940 [Crocinitomicaceae bacterium]|nr:hypothetical protein [Crocinitomicaceae bacterium]
MNYSFYNFDPIMLVIVIILAIGIYLAIYIPYILNIKNTLEQIRPSNRSVEPSNAWLLIIPLFQIIYQFIIYPKLSESIQRECESRNINKQGDYAKNLGVALSILSLNGIVKYFMPGLGSLMGLGSLVVFIIFWVKIYNFKDLFRRIPEGDNIIGGGSTDLLDN